MRLLPILFFALLITACESTVDLSELVYQNGKYLVKGTETVYSGGVTGLESGSIEDGIKQGIWEENNMLGNKLAEGSYTDGYKTGPWKLFHEESGQLWKQGAYDAKGLKTGEWSTFGKDGILWQKGNYALDRQQGAWEYYHLNGNVRSRGTMIDGKRDGEWIKYDEEGLESSRKVWNKGTPVE